jgi:hypothetical protein
MREFPLKLLQAKEAQWGRGMVTSGSEPDLAGETQLLLKDGGGLWTLDMVIEVKTAQKGGLIRTLIEGMDGGVNPVIMPFLSDESRHLGHDPGVPVPHSDGALFSDGAGYVGSEVDIVTASAANLRATTLPVTINTSQPMWGTEAFSIWHVELGPRLYKIVSVPEYSPDAAVLEIRPPLREAVVPGLPLDFERPRCVMKITNAREALGRIKPPWSFVVTLNFIETLNLAP